MEMAVEQTKTRVRSEARGSTTQALLRDCRHAVRLIRHNLIYVVTSILLIAASIGLTCTAFAVFDALVLRKLPVAEPDQLAMVSGAIKTGRIPLTRSMFDALSRDRQGITQIFGFLGMGISGWTDGGASIFAVEEVVGDFFTAQGAVPELGRLFGQAERDMVAVISDKAWRTQFGADPSVLSRSITNDRPRKNSDCRCDESTVPRDRTVCGYRCIPARRDCSGSEGSSSRIGNASGSRCPFWNTV